MIDSTGLFLLEIADYYCVLHRSPAISRVLQTKSTSHHVSAVPLEKFTYQHLFGAITYTHRRYDGFLL